MQVVNKLPTFLDFFGYWSSLATPSSDSPKLKVSQNVGLVKVLTRVAPAATQFPFENLSKVRGPVSEYLGD